MKKETVYKILKTLLLLLAFIVIGLIFYYALKQLVPGFLAVIEHGDEEEIQEYIRSAGSVKGYALVAALQFVQVVSVFFPSVPIQIAAGIILGAVGAYLVCHLSYVAANVTVFHAVRWINKKFKYTPPPNTGKGGKWRFITNSDHPAFMVMLACLIPLVPNGIIPHLAARTRVRASSFTAAVFIGSMPTIFVLCAVGNRVLHGDFIEAAILIILLLVTIFVLYKNQNKFVAFAVKTVNRIREKYNLPK